MLSLQERYGVLKFFRFFCIWSLFPVQVDPKTRKISTATYSKRKAGICKASFVLYVLHSLYTILMLIYAIFDSERIPLHQIIIHGVLATASANYGYCYYVQYIRHADVTVGFRNLTLALTMAQGTENVCRNQAQEKFYMKIFILTEYSCGGF